MKTKLFMSALALSAMSFAAPAGAETVQLNGSVAQVCNVTPGSNNVNWGDLGATGAVGSATYNYTLYCNVQYDAVVSSLYGRMLNTGATLTSIGAEGGARENEYLPSAANTFFAALDYEISSPSFSTISSASFQGGVPYPVANDAAPIWVPTTLTFNPLELTAPQQLTAGSYTDTITVTITPGSL